MSGENPQEQIDKYYLSLVQGYNRQNMPKIAKELEGVVSDHVVLVSEHHFSNTYYKQFQSHIEINCYNINGSDFSTSNTSFEDGYDEWVKIPHFTPFYHFTFGQRHLAVVLPTGIVELGEIPSSNCELKHIETAVITNYPGREVNQPPFVLKNGDSTDRFGNILKQPMFWDGFFDKNYTRCKYLVLIQATKEGGFKVLKKLLRPGEIPKDYSSFSGGAYKWEVETPSIKQGRIFNEEKWI